MSRKRVVLPIAGTAIVAISLLVGGVFLGGWHHTTQEGHSPHFGLDVDLVSSGSPGEARSYSGTLTNYGVLPVFVTTCDAITDTLARESILAYAVERREPTATSWMTVFEVSSATHWCEPFSTGIGQGRVTKRLLWPMQRRSTAPFFWYSAHTAGGLFNVGDEGRIVIFPEGFHDLRMPVAAFRVE